MYEMTKNWQRKYLLSPMFSLVQLIVEVYELEIKNPTQTNECSHAEEGE